MKFLTDTVSLRVKRLRAYRADQYTFSPPPVYCGNWDEQAWCNHVQFNDKALTGFLPYDNVKHKDAMNRI